MSRVVVNVAVGGRHGVAGNYYPGAQVRLARTLLGAGQYDGPVAFWRDEYPAGCEPHSQVPYYFKAMAMSDAVARGHRTLLWLDAVMMVLRPVDEVLRQIEDQGYLVWSHPLAGWSVGAWTSDPCLKYFSVSRSAAFDMPMLCSAVFGYSLDHPLGKELHERFVLTPGSAFHGRWHNRNNVVARDRRVNGHRHDQSVLSIIAHQLRLKLSPTPEPASLIGFQSEKTTFLHDAEGVRGWS